MLTMNSLSHKAQSRLLLLLLGTALLLCSCGGTVTKVQDLSSPLAVVLPDLTQTKRSGSIQDVSTQIKQAQRLEDPQQRLTMLLEAGESLYGPATGASPSPETRELYNALCGEVTALADRLPDAGGLPVQDHTGHLADQDAIVASGRFVVKKLEFEVKQSGIGGALTAFNAHSTEEDTNFANGLTTAALTSVLTYDESGQPTLHVYDPARTHSITLNGREHTLTADFSTPLGLVGSAVPRGARGFQGMVRPEANEWIRGLHFTEPYRQDEIPLVFIHGLQSSPLAWLDAYLSIMADPRLRENYQVWYYRYPTGYGIARNGTEFRNAYLRALEHHDPGRSNPSLSQTMLVGHSMGGLITSLSIREGGDRIWDMVADKPLEEADLDSRTKKQVEEAIYFEPLREVSRVVFMATPHRGSQLANSPAGRLGSKLVRTPERLINLERPGLASAFNDFGQEIFSQESNSIDELEAHSFQLETLNSLPMSPRVRYHSIIGNRNGAPLEESSDGVVPYWSSHLEGALSEKVVPSNHGVTDHPEAIAELKRILHLHLDEAGR